MSSSNDFYDETIASHFLASEAHKHEATHRCGPTNPHSEQPPLFLYVFPRADNKINWIAVGAWAKIIAAEQMRSSTLVRDWTYNKSNRPQQIPALIITSDSTFHDSIKDGLLNKAVSVYVHEKNSRTNQWQVSLRGSPGLPGDFENILYSDPDAASEALASVTCAILMRPPPTGAAGKVLVSIAMVSTSQRNLWFGEQEDNSQLQSIDATLTQWAAKEVYIDSAAERDHPEALQSLRRIIQRSNGICLRVIQKQDVRAVEHQPETVMRKLGQILRVPEAADKVSDHPFCRTALGILITATNLTAEGANISAGSPSSPSNDDDSSRVGRGTYGLTHFAPANYLRLDTAAIDALNIVSRGGSEKITITTNSGSDNNNGTPETHTVPISIFGWLNRCTTASGARMMRQWLLQPLRNKYEIIERQDVVQALVDLPILRSALAKDVFSKCGNMDATVRKLQRHTASLKDIFGLLGFVESIPNAIHFLKMHSQGSKHQETLDDSFLTPLEDLASTFQNLRTLIVATIEQTHTGQFIIVPQFDDTLAETHAKLEEAKAKIDNEFNSVMHQYGWTDKTLKRDVSPAYGVHFRVSRQQDQAVRNHSKAFKILQTTKDGVRFTTDRLKSINEDNQVFEKEYEARQATLHKKLVDTAASYVGVLDDAKELFARLDVFCSWAAVASNSRSQMCRPVFVDEDEEQEKIRNDNNNNNNTNTDDAAAAAAAPAPSVKYQATLDLEDLWHPLVEARRSYVASTVKLGSASDTGYTRGWIITGPNMGGKSTFMRSVGVAAVLAQCGCFVPARNARMSVMDSVLCRVGAMDFLSSGISTFMAEMLESSVVLSAATDRSLVIVDELGRGTSTFDGFGLAWTIAEEIVIKSRALMVFATHFHEMTHIETTSKGRLKNVHVSAETHGNELLRFLYSVQPGPCDRSFGVQIAQMAGLPEKVVAEARLKAQELERTKTQPNSSADGESSGELLRQDNNNNNNGSSSSGDIVIKTEKNNNTNGSSSDEIDIFNQQNRNNNNGAGSSSSGFFKSMSGFGTSQPGSVVSSGSPEILSFGDGAFGFLDTESRQKLLELAAQAAKLESIAEIESISREAQQVAVMDD